MFMRAIAVCSGLIVALPAWAQTPAPATEAEPPAAAPVQPPAAPPAATPTPAPPAAESEDPRYSFSRIQDGYLRLDVRTGQVAQCSRRQVGWACQVLPDDRIVLENEIARLQAENGALKKELLSRGIALPSGVRAPPAAAAAKPKEEPKSSDSDLNRVMTAVESMWRRLVEMIGNLQRDVMKKS
jgi:hypothetical protein